MIARTKSSLYSISCEVLLVCPLVLLQFCQGYGFVNHDLVLDSQTHGFYMPPEEKQWSDIWPVNWSAVSMWEGFCVKIPKIQAPVWCGYILRKDYLGLLISYFAVQDCSNMSWYTGRVHFSWKSKRTYNPALNQASQNIHFWANPDVFTVQCGFCVPKSLHYANQHFLIHETLPVQKTRSF